jgi:hypothetical protein
MPCVRVLTLGVLQLGGNYDEMKLPLNTGTNIVYIFLQLAACCDMHNIAKFDLNTYQFVGQHVRLVDRFANDPGPLQLVTWDSRTKTIWATTRVSNAYLVFERFVDCNCNCRTTLPTRSCR